MQCDKCGAQVTRGYKVQAQPLYERQHYRGTVCPGCIGSVLQSLSEYHWVLSRYVTDDKVTSVLDLFRIVKNVVKPNWDTEPDGLDADDAADGWDTPFKP